MASAQAPYISTLDASFTANSDLSPTATGPNKDGSYRYTAVIAFTTADLTIDKVGGANAKVLGILQNEPTAGSGATVMLLGISKLIVDGSGTAIAAGDILKTDSSGRGVHSAGTTGDEIFAVALQASTAANDEISAYISRYTHP